MAVSGLSPMPPRAASPFAIPQDRPVYRITAEKGFFGPDDNLYPAQSIIVWMDEPNPEMEPLNDMAHKALTAYLTKLDDFARKVAEKVGTSYTSMADAYKNSLESAKQDSKKFEVLGTKEQVPLMGAKKRGPKKVEQIQVEQAAPQMGNKGKLNIDSFGRDSVNKVGE